MYFPSDNTIIREKEYLRRRKENKMKHCKKVSDYNNVNNINNKNNNLLNSYTDNDNNNISNEKILSKGNINKFSSGETYTKSTDDVNNNTLLSQIENDDYKNV